MAYTTHPTVVTGQTWTAANHNTYVKDNFDAVWVGTTAGDTDYYTSSTAKSRLGIGTAYQVKSVNAGATAPAWTDLSTITANKAMTTSQAAGDVFYASSGTALARLAKGTAFYSLRMNTGATAPEWGVPVLQYCIAYNSTTQTLTDAAYTALLFDSEVDPWGWHLTSSDTSRITITEDGIYNASWFLEYVGASGTGTYTDITELRLNGSTVIVRQRLYLEKDANNKMFYGSADGLQLTAGQYLEVYHRNGSGANKTTTSSPLCRFTLIRIA